ncbi:MAG: glycosyltransferase family 1 protein [Paludibacteraceae bacterium]|nr:glycosyltransferase family 1 protein [Prevotella sp.]MBP3466123.1 glycosyltransferase family 1 protein [Paludibacteraceae bacterium]
MKLKVLYTKRKYDNRFFFDLVYEWEDVLTSELGLRAYHYDEAWSKWGGYKCLQNGFLRRLIKRFNFVKWLFLPTTLGLKLDMWTELCARYNSNNIVPWIIDFFLEPKDFSRFNEAYKHYPLVLISSKEVYDVLMAHKDVVRDVNLRHVALSLSDKYRITSNTHYKKEYDVVLMGRQNPVLEKFFYQYVEQHPSIKYAYRKMEGEHFYYYAVENGRETFIGDINERVQYIDLMRKSRIGLHATPDIDTDHQRAHGYNQVTPRFLEWISSGAHVIARYVPNPDTEYYQLQDFSKSIETYEQFEQAMDYAMTHEVDMKKYADYLQQHYTSVRAKEIKQIVDEL